jgi:hypothetical protein
MITRTRVQAAQLALAAAVLFAGGQAFAQGDKGNRPKKMKDRVALLEEQVDDMKNTVSEITGADSPDEIRSRLDALQDNLDGMLRDLEELRSMADDAAADVEEREARLDALADEVSSLWDEVEAQRQLVDEAAASKNAGYEDGFFLASDDGQHRLELTGFARPYFRAAFQKQWEADEYGVLLHDPVTGEAIGGDTEVVGAGFGLEDTRLVVHALMFGVVHAMVAFEYGTQHGEVTYPLNANVPPGNEYGRVEIHEHSVRFTDVYAEFAPFAELTVRLGQFRPAFDREGSGFHEDELTFSTRSLMTRRYPRWGEQGMDPSGVSWHWDYEIQRGSYFGYDRGLQIAGSIADAKFKYNLGAFNGGGPNVENDNRDIMVAIRLATDPLGPMTHHMSDIEVAESPLLSIGAAFAYDLPEHRDPVDPLRTYNSSDINIAGDAHFKWMGASLLAGVFYRRADHGAVIPVAEGLISSMGFSGQLAYYIAAAKLEPAFRYGFYDADVDRELDHVHEFTGALNYYIYGRHLNVGLEWRGLFAAQKTRTYLLPWGEDALGQPIGPWFEDMHEITIKAQVSF